MRGEQVPVALQGQESGRNCPHECRFRRVDCAQCRIRDELFFARLNVEPARELLKPIRAATLDRGEVIYRQGESGGALFSLRRGLVRLSLLDSEGVEHTVRLLGKGALIGLESTLPQPYRHTAAAVSDVDVCRIPAETLAKLAAAQPTLHADLMAQWQNQLDIADASLVAHSTGAVRDRVMHYLKDLDALCRHSGVRLWLPPNRDCASMVSSTVESVSRIMADMKRSGVLTHRSDGSWELNPE